MELTAPDAEMVVCDLLRAKLPARWTGSFSVGRTRGEHLPAVTVQRGGGVGVSRLIDQAVLVVNVYGSTEAEANSFAAVVSSVLNSLQGHSPVISCVAGGPASLQSDDVPQRYISATLRTRKASHA